MMTGPFGGEEKGRKSKKTKSHDQDRNAYDHNHPIHPSEARLMTESSAWNSETAGLHGLSQLIRELEGLN
jgi:hypothetical protein